MLSSILYVNNIFLNPLELFRLCSHTHLFTFNTDHLWLLKFLKLSVEVYQWILGCLLSVTPNSAQDSFLGSVLRDPFYCGSGDQVLVTETESAACKVSAFLFSGFIITVFFNSILFVYLITLLLVLVILLINNLFINLFSF